MLTRSKIKGMVVGGAIGDAAGKPVETWTPEKILEVHPNGLGVGKHPPGTTTDDEQLKTANMFGLIEGKDAAERMQSFEEYHHAMAIRHVLALKESDAGWGNTTRETVKQIANGCPWYKAGSEIKWGGTGNGVPMKVAPLAAWFCSPASKVFTDAEHFYFYHQIVRHAAMTHNTDLAAWAGIVHTVAVKYCLMSDLAAFSTDEFLALVAEDAFEWGEEKSKGRPNYYSLEGLRKHKGPATVGGTDDDPDFVDDSLELRMLWLFQHRGELTTAGSLSFTTQELGQLRCRFNNGSCYVLDSLPFSYAFFIKNPFTPQSIIDVIEAGGDTDTNGSFVGEMVGALNGIEVFETDEWRWMIDGLQCYDRLIEMADLFCDTMGIE